MRNKWFVVHVDKPFSEINCTFRPKRRGEGIRIKNCRFLLIVLGEQKKYFDLLTFVGFQVTVVNIAFCDNYLIRRSSGEIRIIKQSKWHSATQMWRNR